MKKFLTAFEKPVRIKGYALFMYFLIDDVSSIHKVDQWHDDINKGGILTSRMERKGVYKIEVANVLSGEDTTFRFYLADFSDPENVLTEKILITEKPPRTGVYLRWENDLAGYDYWLFSGNEIDVINARTNDRFHPYKDEIEDETDNFEILRKEFNESIRLFTSFEKCNKEGFKQLARSRKVDMFHKDKWWKVDVSMRDFTISKHQPYGKCSIDVILPKKYVK